MSTNIQKLCTWLANGGLFFKTLSKKEKMWCIGTQILTIIGTIFVGIAIIENTFKQPFLVFAVVFLSLSVLLMCILVPYLLQRISMSINIDYGKEFSNMEYKYYEISLENDKKIRAIRHDISNQIQTIYSLLKNGDNQKGLELIDELKSRYDYVNQIVYCNNPVVNIILSNKRTEAEKHGIETHIKVMTELENIPFSDYDLSTIICNLLDNAVRGCVCSNQSHPRMIVEILHKNNYLVIRVLNSCKVSMHIESTDRIATTKSGSQYHGIGMPIIAGIAKKYCGDFVVSAQNGIFTATVVLSMK